jgi:hypothetical protein
MSGGYFEHKDFILREFADEIKRVVSNNGKKIEEDGLDISTSFSKETIEEFKNAIYYLKMAEQYVHRIDWLLSGDDGEESFHNRLQPELTDIRIEHGR